MKLGELRYAVMFATALLCSSLFAGCESGDAASDEGGIVFLNNSTQVVTVMVGGRVGPVEAPVFKETGRHTLVPEQSVRVTEGFPGYRILYYMYAPERSVQAQDVSPTEVIFVDR